MFQILSRDGIVLRELLGSTNPIGLRAEEPFISDRALGNCSSLLFQDHRLGSVVASNSHLILQLIDSGRANRLNRLSATSHGKHT
jgi:hypothetical protein